MLNLDFIKTRFGDSLVSAKISLSRNEKAQEIELLENQSSLLSDIIYIGTQKKLEEMLVSEITIEKGTVIFSSHAEKPLQSSLLKGKGIELIETSLAIAECYNLVNTELRKSRKLYNAAFLMQYENRNPQSFLEYISSETGTSAFLFDSEGYVLAEANKAPSYIPVIKKIIKEGRLSKGQQQALKAEGTSCGSFKKLKANESGMHIYYRYISLSKEESAIIMLAGNEITELTDIDTLMYYFEAPIVSAIKRLREIGLSENDLRFKRIWDNIMEKRFNSASEIRENLSSFEVAPFPFARVLVVEYRKSSAPTSLMLSELHTIFPAGHIAAGEQEFVIILYYPERPASTDIEDNILLKAFLEKYDAHMGFSCAARDLTILPNQYRIAKKIVNLAIHLKLEPGERIYRHERYSVYCIIEHFAQHYYGVNGNNDIILLIHPAIVNLTRYDQMHDNNLRDLFHEYLLNDCSVSKTAAKTYMHRNTIMNKLKKITEMINVDLEDGVVCQQLLFSCQVILYYERVMGLSISQ